MRRGEALGLRWSDVDLDAGRLRVVQTITQVRSKVSIGEPKTTRGRRSIALDDGTVAVLRAHRKLMLEERLLVGPDFTDEGLVFHHPDGSCLRPDAVSAQFLRRVDRHGLPRLTLHGLRHTWATLALEQRHPPAGRPGAPRPLDDRHHARHLQPRRPDAPRRGGRTRIWHVHLRCLHHCSALCGCVQRARRSLASSDNTPRLSRNSWPQESSPVDTHLFRELGELLVGPRLLNCAG